MKYGVSIIVRGDDAKPDTFVKMAELAERDAWDCLWASDHLIMPTMKTSSYPGRADGQLPDPWKSTYYQPFSVLNFLAGLTSTVRLGMSVLILPMRNPLEVAAQVAEMDQLSSGRVNFGVGVGWYREEFEALGFDFSNRGRRTDDGLEIIRRLWTEKKTSADGPFYKFIDAEMGPKPQQSRVPIYMGGNTKRAIRRLSRYGDVWHPFKISPEQLRDARPILDAELKRQGRNVSGFPIAVKIHLVFGENAPQKGQSCTEGSASDIIDSLKRYRDAGATEFCFDLLTETCEVALETMQRFVQEVRPHLDD